MWLPIPIRRLVYRCAYWVLRGYWLLRRPQVTGVKCVVSADDRVLLVRHTYGPREWDLPGGMVRRNESPMTTARREMHEELGVLIQEWRAIGQLSARIHHRRDLVHCFEGELEQASVAIDRVEIAAAGWFSRDVLPTELTRYVPLILAKGRRL